MRVAVGAIDWLTRTTDGAALIAEVGATAIFRVGAVPASEDGARAAIGAIDWVVGTTAGAALIEVAAADICGVADKAAAEDGVRVDDALIIGLGATADICCVDDKAAAENGVRAADALIVGAGATADIC